MGYFGFSVARETHDAHPRIFYIQHYYQYLLRSMFFTSSNIHGLWSKYSALPNNTITKSKPSTHVYSIFSTTICIYIYLQAATYIGYGRSYWPEIRRTHGWRPWKIVIKYSALPINTITKRSEYHTQLAKMSCDKIFDLTACWSVFSFFIIYRPLLLLRNNKILCIPWPWGLVIGGWTSLSLLIFFFLLGEQGERYRAYSRGRSSHRQNKYGVFIPLYPSCSGASWPSFFSSKKGA